MIGYDNPLCAFAQGVAYASIFIRSEVECIHSGLIVRFPLG